MHASLDAKKLTSDAAILLALLMIATAFKAGTDYATAIGVSGLLAIGNFWVLSLLVKRLVDQGDNALLFGLGFIAKIFLVGGTLYGLTRVLEPTAVLIGFGVVLMAITLRGVADAALSAKDGTNERA
jgi:uncharacterized SAM-binding protein YcdF (DUF218 family)